MNVTRSDAASALRDIDTVQKRAQTAFGYRNGSPYLLLWGVLWIIAGTVGALAPGNAGLGWLAADIAGLIGTGCLIAAQARRDGSDGARGRVFRYVAVAAVLAVFIALTLSLFAPVTGVEVQSFIVLLVGAAYVILGCWFGLRYAVVGVAIAALAAGTCHFAPAHAALVVPLLGGGALILGGLWMRRAW